MTAQPTGPASFRPTVDLHGADPVLAQPQLGIVTHREADLAAVGRQLEKHVPISLVPEEGNSALNPPLLPADEAIPIADYIAASLDWSACQALDAIERFLRRYVAFPSDHEAVAVALWIGHDHVVDRFDVSPILTVTSAEMRSGKTRVLDCLELLVPEPFRVVMPSEAVVYTVLGQRPRPTLLLDEADAIFGTRSAERYEGLRAILNAGNRRGTPVLRVKLEGKRREVEAFDVFGPKAIAGIGKLPDTVADRSVPIRMRRRAPNETVARFRQRTAAAEAAELDFDWTTVPVVPDVPVPEALNDRAADSWEPLLAIADGAGGSWPERARLAAVVLSSGDDDQVSVGIRLLSDIREALGTDDHLPTAELLRRLHQLEEAPWADWYGKQLTARGLAKLLEPYRVNPVRKRDGQANLRGYFAVDFEDAFERYLIHLQVDVGLDAIEGSGSSSTQSLPAPATGTSGTPGTPTLLDVAQRAFADDLLEPVK